MKNDGLSTDPYKGVRDFYPEDLYVRNRIFKTMGQVAKSYGYVEYGSSILEPTELYTAKTNEEIVSEQTYTFTDRGGRSVTLRPEVTPSLARMVAGRRRELPFPLRWYTIANVFRYERPQRGRLREHWQLNVDLMGLQGIEAELEIISVITDLMYALGATDDDFIIRINSRKLMNALFADHFALSPTEIRSLMQTVDRRDKISEAEFVQSIESLIGANTEHLMRFLNAGNLAVCTEELPQEVRDMEGVRELEDILRGLVTRGIHCVTFDPSLVRGFDYYTGVVFEVFDTNPKNKRSLFGGGRFDRLVELFGAEPVPAVGFGAGDVSIRDFLEVRGLLPRFKASAHLYIAKTETRFQDDAMHLARTLRKEGVNVEVDFTTGRVGDQIRIANKHGIPYCIVVGEAEVSESAYTIKELATSTETKLARNEIAPFILKHKKD